MQLLQEARQKMGIADSEPADQPLPVSELNLDTPPSAVRRAAARCWALLLARIYECLPLLCPRCGEPMRIIAFVLDPAVIARILTHLGEPTAAPPLGPARGPPQTELGFEQVDPSAGGGDWPEIDQSGGIETWD